MSVKLLNALLLTAAAAIPPTEVAAQKSEGDRPRLSEVRIGIANHYKVGHWIPVSVELENADALSQARIEVTVADSDGVATTATAPVQSTDSRNGAGPIIVYTKVGRIGAPIRIALLSDGAVLDETTLRSIPGAKTSSSFIELPATAELLVSLASAPFGLQQAFVPQDADGGEVVRRTIRLTDVTKLPVDWFGYDGVDLLVISAGDGDICRKLAADNARYGALVRWVERGGRLVILCGGEPAMLLLAEGGALAGLAPGNFEDLVRLTETGPLEHFAEPAPSIGRAGAGNPILVPQLSEVEGKIEVYAGRRATDLPLVIRAPRGLGEVAFAAVDVATPPLAGWSGRTAFLQALLRPYTRASSVDDTRQTLMTLGYNDLSGALRQRLGRAFESVVPLGFPTVAALAIAYLLVLGPLDYLVVHRWLRRPLAAWITFPIIVLLFGLSALALAEWRKGTAGERLNSLELIDVDAATGQTRGTLWTAVYATEATKLDLSMKARSAPASVIAPTEFLFSWWGLPGVGIGGMQAGGSNIGIVRDAYRYAADRSALEGLPVLASATKSLVGRWTATGSSAVEAQLNDEDGFATGSLVNRSGRTLRDAVLLYGSWGYQLDDLEHEQQVDVGEFLAPLSVKTIVTRSAIGKNASALERERAFMPERASATELLHLMMFYEAAGGAAFAQLPHRAQADYDLSRHLMLGRAILVAKVDEVGSRLIHSATQEVVGNESGQRAVIYRFVLPVDEATN